MRRLVAALIAVVLATVVLSACGSSGPAHVSAPHESALAPGAIVLVADGPSSGLGIDNTDLVAASSSGRTHDLTSSAAAESDATWSADGSHVVFIRQSTTGDRSGAVAFRAGVYVWSPGHGAPQRIASCLTYCEQNEFAWSPDDRHIAFVSYANDSAIKVMNADGGGIHTVCDAARCGDGLNGPAWSPDGHKLVFADGVPGMGPYDPPSYIWVANADGSGAKRLTQRSCTTVADQQTRRVCARHGSDLVTGRPTDRLQPLASPSFRTGRRHDGEERPDRNEEADAYAPSDNHESRSHGRRRHSPPQRLQLQRALRRSGSPVRPGRRRQGARVRAYHGSRRQPVVPHHDARGEDGDDPHVFGLALRLSGRPRVVAEREGAGVLRRRRPAHEPRLGDRSRRHGHAAYRRRRSAAASRGLGTSLAQRREGGPEGLVAAAPAPGR